MYKASGEEFGRNGVVENVVVITPEAVGGVMLVTTADVVPLIVLPKLIPPPPNARTGPLLE